MAADVPALIRRRATVALFPKSSYHFGKNISDSALQFLTFQVNLFQEEWRL